ncbi:GNAT family N-acetyltransferase [Thiocystis violacea]|uniref:GNAT family N-acetyltransferase n=1 Tax=Thiocystis violacea TaxID=13725 RepID=UPI0019041D27|nr:GNAT family N-acetyltransferase [Thiocystis violacea]MBK1718622.1 GNAT family N-acetyltransferase [Thiocystis violacea]
MNLEAPAPLTAAHIVSGFSCGVASLDDWLMRRAWANQSSGASRTYVAAASGKVKGYYCLASGALASSEAPGGLRRNMPDPIPMAVLGRLAVAHDWQGRGLGVALLRDAVERTQAASAILGIRGLLVQALSEPVAAFYRRYGFIASPTQPLTLVLSLKRRV